MEKLINTILTRLYPDLEYHIEAGVWANYVYLDNVYRTYKPLSSHVLYSKGKYHEVNVGRIKSDLMNIGGLDFVRIIV